MRAGETVKNSKPSAGIEPATIRLRDWCSTTELKRLCDEVTVFNTPKNGVISSEASSFRDADKELK